MLLINIDVLVDGIYFSDVIIIVMDVGWCVVVVNLFDLVVSGVVDIDGIIVVLVVLGYIYWDWVNGVY